MLIKKIILNWSLDKRKKISSDRGFSLVETVIALTTLGICLAYAMPLFLYAKINNTKSDIRTGALIVSQRVFDNIRSRPLVAATGPVTNNPLPTTDGRARDTGDPTLSSAGTAWQSGGNTDGSNPVVQPANMTIPKLISDGGTIEPKEKLLTYAMGRQYRTKVTFCEFVTTSDPTACTNQYRKFKVEVFYNGNKVYDLQGNYTEFE
jgi:type II secretory pathway pseudopilin PulG